MIRVTDFVEQLNLTELTPSNRRQWNIVSADYNRPGLQFAGFYNYFAWERPQVIGKVEMTYLSQMTPEERAAMYERYFSYDIPCIICCRAMRPPEDFLEAARQHGVGVYLTGLVTTHFTFRAIHYLNRCLAPHKTVHGVLVDVYGTGVLITGRSGVGKSETALELVKRGHQLVADDVVDICREQEGELIGECPEMVRHFMEIRGIGIIDVRAMFGIGAVKVTKKIDLVVHLEEWAEGRQYDRLGLHEEYETILNVNVPRILMPVRPGRNLAIIIEVAARNHSLRQVGYSAAHELDRRLNVQMMQASREESEN